LLSNSIIQDQNGLQIGLGDYYLRYYSLV